MTAERPETAEPPARAGRGCFPFYWCFRFLLRILFRLGWRWRRNGLGRLPASGPVLVASNHASYLDPMLIGSAFDRPVGFMARRNLFRGLFGFLIAKLYAFPVDRDGDPRAALRVMEERLAEGACVLLFPEGTRTRNGRLGEIKRGVGHLAVKSGAAVLPVYIGGAFESWPRTKRLFRFHPIRISAGELLLPRPASEDRSARKDEERRIQEAVASELTRLEAEYAAERNGNAGAAAADGETPDAAG